MNLLIDILLIKILNIKTKKSIQNLIIYYLLKNIKFILFYNLESFRQKLIIYLVFLNYIL
jgi:hypothetical protein